MTATIIIRVAVRTDGPYSDVDTIAEQLEVAVKDFLTHDIGDFDLSELDDPDPVLTVQEVEIEQT